MRCGDLFDFAVGGPVASVAPLVLRPVPSFLEYWGHEKPAPLPFLVLLSWHREFFAALGNSLEGRSA